MPKEASGFNNESRQVNLTGKWRAFTVQSNDKIEMTAFDDGARCFFQSADRQLS